VNSSEALLPSSRALDRSMRSTFCWSLATVRKPRNSNSTEPLNLVSKPITRLREMKHGPDFDCRQCVDRSLRRQLASSQEIATLAANRVTVLSFSLPSSWQPTMPFWLHSWPYAPSRTA
jgi:hypothetical protein